MKFCDPVAVKRTVLERNHKFTTTPTSKSFFFFFFSGPFYDPRARQGCETCKIGMFSHFGA